MTREELDALWRDPQNWGEGPFGVYFCKRDPRLFPPKRVPGLGWTVNWAHPAAGLVLVALILAPVLMMSGVVIPLIRAAVGQG